MVSTGRAADPSGKAARTVTSARSPSRKPPSGTEAVNRMTGVSTSLSTITTNPVDVSKGQLAEQVPNRSSSQEGSSPEGSFRTSPPVITRLAATRNGVPSNGDTADPDTATASYAVCDTPSATLSSTNVKPNVTDPLAASAGTTNRKSSSATGSKSGPPGSVAPNSNCTTVSCPNRAAPRAVAVTVTFCGPLTPSATNRGDTVKSNDGASVSLSVTCTTAGDTP